MRDEDREARAAFRWMMRYGGDLAVAWDRDVKYVSPVAPRLHFVDKNGVASLPEFTYVDLSAPNDADTDDRHYFRRARWWPDSAEALGGHWTLESRRWGEAHWYPMDERGDQIK